MKRVIIGGIITLVIGGTGYTISQTDVVNNFAKNTGMSQQQAQKYADDAQKNLVSFTKIGKQLTTDGNLVISEQSKIDCINYKYKWESPSLSCDEGSIELQTIGNNEIQLGKCYEALDTNLGTTANSKISECITDIDATDASYDLPIAAQILGDSGIADFKNSNIYNKSILQSSKKSN